MTQRVVNYTYGTGNPVLPNGSIDVRDGIDNLQSLDVFMNAPEDTYNQRDGNVVRTVAGMNNEFDAKILNMGFTRIGTFAAGATLTNPRQTLLWDIADGGDGQEYGWSGSFPKVVPAVSTPASTGGISVGAWISRFDPELRIQVREALRRSYAEAGYNLVDGSFEVGGTLVNANDVLLHEASGKAFSGPAGPVAAGTDPLSGVFVDRSPLATNDTQVNAAIFASLQDAVNHATSTGKKLVVDGDWSVDGDLIISWFNLSKPWNAEFNGVITATGDIRFQGLANAHLTGGIFVADRIFLQGIRKSSMKSMVLAGDCYIGKWDGSPAGASWSLYWNKFDTVEFGAIHVRTSISGGASINGNEWSNCLYRDNQTAGQLWEMDVAPGTTDPAFAGNAFINCDWSYAPAWNFKYDYGNSFGANVVGGYLDTGSAWYHPNSALHQRFNVNGLRNPSGVSLGHRPTADDKITTGSARRTAIHPVSAKSLLKNPVSVIKAGTNSTVFNLLSIPCNGDYSVNIITTSDGSGGLVTINNITSGTSVAFNPQSVGQSNCIFSAMKDDVVTVTWTTPSLAQDILIHEISVTLGAGVHGAVPLAVHSPWEYDSGEVSVTTTPIAFATIPVGTLRLQMRDVLITTRVAVAGGGGEMIKLSASMVSGSSAAAITLDEYSRARVNGVGGTSDDPQPLVITTSTSGTSVTILASVATGAVTARCRVGYSVN